ncbi:hypothetical protein AB832_07635 [Flavobacteriaceae bacterium (ex Bugula neritina AB1)]|nr:hypothetical protein AB832_07635 [Flavobacteriaceae bacterium (ex Bugula neritina AB1)]
MTELVSIPKDMKECYVLCICLNKNHCTCGNITADPKLYNYAFNRFRGYTRRRALELLNPSENLANNKYKPIAKELEEDPKYDLLIDYFKRRAIALYDNEAQEHLHRLIEKSKVDPADLQDEDGNYRDLDELPFALRQCLEIRYFKNNPSTTAIIYKPKSSDDAFNALNEYFGITKNKIDDTTNKASKTRFEDKLEDYASEE